MTMTATQWMIEPLRKYAVFTGRARRSEYWWYTLFATLLGFGAGIIDAVLALGAGTVLPGGVGIVGSLLSLALLIPGLAVQVRRLHDLNKTGWLALLPVIPAIGLIVGSAMMLVGGGLAIAGVSGLALGVIGILFLVWFCQRGTVGPNRYGPDPYDAD